MGRHGMNNRADLKKTSVIFAVFVSAILLLSIGSCMLNQQIESIVISSSDPEPFYVGVTYCGDSVSEAKQLIDKVKTYTNLFVLQSGSLQFRLDEINQIVNYAVECDLNFIVYFGIQYGNYCNDWLENFDHRWDNHFLGVYVGDEPGGKMLDSYTSYSNRSSRQTVNKNTDGGASVSIHYSNGHSSISYRPDGTILVIKGEFVVNISDSITTYATYFPNGTIVVDVRDRYGTPIQVENETYIPYSSQELWNLYPFKNYNVTADWFMTAHQSNLASLIGDHNDVTSFTSDYALYWFDYLSGYDVILSQFGWNHTLTQDIAMVRGAANLQNKNWGVIMTWKYNHPPYLDTGEAIYEQLRTAYVAGAKYAVIFNYAENMTGPYGILQEEHFLALERFWNEVVQNPEVKNGSILGEVALVLPMNYGWGMRNLDDTIWGLWDADEKSEQIWNLRGDLIQEYGLTLDIVYDDPAFPVEGKYIQTFYTPTEKTESFPTWIVATIVVIAVVGAALLVYFVKVKKTTGEVKE
jgi:hypothetical protein